MNGRNRTCQVSETRFPFCARARNRRSATAAGTCEGAGGRIALRFLARCWRKKLGPALRASGGCCCWDPGLRVARTARIRFTPGWFRNVPSGLVRWAEKRPRGQAACSGQSVARPARGRPGREEAEEERLDEEPRMKHGRNTEEQTTKDTKHTKLRRQWTAVHHCL